MFAKILVANRGEIACRIMRTARRMGIATVAVYCDTDREALHVEMADEAVNIGPPPAAKSYLLIDRIVEAARQTGAEAVHPGYGFLSERAAFAEALGAAGIAFIGPNARAIAAMGDKIESKKFAAAARVSTVPGHLGVIGTDAEAIAVAREIGMPVMIKASAGGGGKGMRIARSENELAEGVRAARSEARAAFGDDRVFIERYVENPRHIEIQVLGDRHGHIVHLGERECSIQRRNQKIVEESPSPAVDAALREKMGAEAVALARAVGYDSAGTVEFIMGEDRGFYFLEMNTRLQVEHPVTEFVTGLDLVEQMIRIAAGEPLGFAQEDVRLDGWAIETRLCAEDPRRNFMPSIGRLTRYRPPAEGRDGLATLRIDAGVDEDSEISVYFDPLMAKVVTHAPDRPDAVAAMGRALDRFLIDGVAHNASLLAAIMASGRWQEGRLSTGFIDEEFPGGFSAAPPDADAVIGLARVALAIELRHRAKFRTMRGRLNGEGSVWRSDWVVAIGGSRLALHASPVAAAPAPFAVDIAVDGGGMPVTVTSSWAPGDALWAGTVGGEARLVQVRPAPGGCLLSSLGVELVARVMTPRVAELDALMSGKRPADTFRQLRCPMPGVVLEIAVETGQEVRGGEPLVVVEAMKMQNVLRAERDARVKRIAVEAGDTLAVDAVIMEFE